MVLADAIWLDEPTRAATLARPKSRIFAVPRLVTKMFAGLMSRWTMPATWAASSASAMSMAMGNSSSISMGRPSMRCFRVWPSRNSMAMKAVTVLFADVVNRADIGVVEGRSRLGFALKTGQGLRIPSYFLGQKLQRDETPQTGVLGLVHHAHAATAEFLNDAVMRNDPVDHEGKRLPRGMSHLMDAANWRQPEFLNGRGSEVTCDRRIVAGVAVHYNRQFSWQQARCHTPPLPDRRAASR